jgi:hypothetical protein
VILSSWSSCHWSGPKLAKARKQAVDCERLQRQLHQL